MERRSKFSSFVLKLLRYVHDQKITVFESPYFEVRA